ncbi:MAG: glycosyltransferase [Nitrospinota bacterium]
MEQRSQINVSLLSTSFPRFDGDFSGNFVYHFARELSEQGVKLEVIVPDDPASQSLSENFKIVRFPYFFPRHMQTLAYGSGIVNQKRQLAWLQLTFLISNFFLTALRSARKSQLIHAFWSASGIVASSIGCIKSRPVVITLWGSDKLVAQIPILSSLILKFLKKTSAIICEEADLKSFLIGKGFNEEKIHLIRNGIDLELFQPRNNEESKRNLNLNINDKILISTGSLNKNKNHSLLVDAFKEISPAHESWRLFIVGDGEERLALEKQIERSGVSERVKLLGFQDHQTLCKWLNAADIFVLPSRNEGTPNALLEAMACGLPVIASKVGGIPELIQDNVEGLLFDPNSKTDLMEKLGKLTHDKELQISLGEAGARKVNHQYGNWKAQAEKLLSLYRKILSDSQK